MRCSSPACPGRPTGGRASRGSRSVGLERPAGRWRWDRDVRQVRDGRDAPRLGAVGEEGVGQVDDRGHVLERDPPRLDGVVEALARRGRRDDGHRRLAVAAEHDLEQVRLLVLVGMPVDGPARWTSTTTRGSSTITARPIASLLSAMPGPDVAVSAHRAAVRRADGGADRRDLVLGLERLDAEVLVARQLVEDVARRGDRVRPVEQVALASFDGATKPSAVASLPVMLRYVPGASAPGTRYVVWNISVVSPNA
jgi:hypothetical protein